MNKELSLAQAALLICELDPANYPIEEEFDDIRDAPIIFKGIINALLNAAETDELPTRKFVVAHYNPWYARPDTGHFTASPNLSPVKTLVKVDDLKIWLESKQMFPSFFFEEVPFESPLDPNNEYFAPKMAAAIIAWNAVTKDPSLLKNRTPRQAIADWLIENREKICDRVGLLSDTAIEEISKIANWRPEGGAPITPSASKRKKR